MNKKEQRKLLCEIIKEDEKDKLYDDMVIWSIHQNKTMFDPHNYTIRKIPSEKKKS